MLGAGLGTTDAMPKSCVAELRAAAFILCFVLDSLPLRDGRLTLSDGAGLVEHNIGELAHTFDCRSVLEYYANLRSNPTRHHCCRRYCKADCTRT